MLTTLQIQWISSTVSAFIAGMVAILASMAIEKLGGLIGGVLASTPTTIVPALIGFSLARGSDENLFVFAMNVPPPLLLNSGLLLAWKMISERLPDHWSFLTKIVALLSSVLLYWFAGALIVVLVIEKGLNLPPLALGLGAIFTHLIFGIIVLFLGPPPAPKGTNKVSWQVLGVRGACACLTVFLGSVIARTHPSAGGFVSCFPAIYLTTMISVWLSQGNKVTSGAAGPMILGGLSVSIFALLFAYIKPVFGILSASILSYVISVVGWSIPLAVFLRWWTSRAGMASPELSTNKPTNENAFELNIVKSDETSDESNNDDSTQIELDRTLEEIRATANV